MFSLRFRRIIQKRKKRGGAAGFAPDWYATLRVAVLSDIHGECYPLDKVLSDIETQRIDQIVCLGDAIQGGSQPKETTKRLRELNCRVVMGNSDAWLLTGRETAVREKTTEKQEEVRRWSLEQLSESDFIKHFEPTIEIPLEDEKKLLCFHGSPRSFNGMIPPSTPDEEVRKFLSGFDALYLAGGHTHTQQFRRLGDSSWYMNPGSVSLPYNWTRSNLETGVVVLDPWAEYAFLSTEGEGNFGVTFRHVTFDFQELTRIVLESGRPYAEESVKLYRR